MDTTPHEVLHLVHTGSGRRKSILSSGDTDWVLMSKKTGLGQRSHRPTPVGQ